jgi:23S rRNA-/tRNA-specific pseudouridylate synthase
MQTDADNVEQGQDRHPEKRAPLEIVHQDDELIIVNKPPGMSPEDGPSDEPSVFEQIRSVAHGASPSPLYPLEASVSGLMVWATTEQSRQSLEAQFLDQRMTVTYLAVVRARVIAETGVIDLPLRVPGRQEDPVRVDEEVGAPAVTHWRLRDAFVGFALLECVPRTRIRAQIRAHLPAAHMPLAVDPLYRGAGELMLSSFKAGYRKSKRRPERPLIHRPALHAASVSLHLPSTGEPATFTAALPKDFRATLHQLDRFGRLPKS